MVLQQGLRVVVFGPSNKILKGVFDWTFLIGVFNLTFLGATPHNVPFVFFIFSSFPSLFLMCCGPLMKWSGQEGLARIRQSMAEHYKDCVSGVGWTSLRGWGLVWSGFAFARRRADC